MLGTCVDSDCAPLGLAARSTCSVNQFFQRPCIRCGIPALELVALLSDMHRMMYKQHKYAKQISTFIAFFPCIMGRGSGWTCSYSA